MNEEIKKNAEINDNELEQVSGGLTAKLGMKQCDSPERHLYDLIHEECPVCKSRNFTLVTFDE